MTRFRPSLPRLRSNRRAASPFIAGMASAGAPELQAQIAMHGHLFFPGLLPRESVLEARAEALALCQDAGWAASQTGALDAQWSGREAAREDDPRWLQFYHQWISATLPVAARTSCPRVSCGEVARRGCPGTPSENRSHHVSRERGAPDLSSPGLLLMYMVHATRTPRGFLSATVQRPSAVSRLLTARTRRA